MLKEEGGAEIDHQWYSSDACAILADECRRKEVQKNWKQDVCLCFIQRSENAGGHEPLPLNTGTRESLPENTGAHDAAPTQPTVEKTLKRKRQGSRR